MKSNASATSATSMSQAIGRFVSELEFGALSPTDVSSLKVYFDGLSSLRDRGRAGTGNPNGA